MAFLEGLLGNFFWGGRRYTQTLKWSKMWEFSHTIDHICFQIKLQDTEILPMPNELLGPLKCFTYHTAIGQHTALVIQSSFIKYLLSPHYLLGIVLPVVDLHGHVYSYKIPF